MRRTSIVAPVELHTQSAFTSQQVESSRTAKEPKQPMPAFVPGFENDLFLSYAHEDDPRWVQAFADELRAEVSSRLGLGITIWQDVGKLRAGENWQASIQASIHRTAAF